MTHHQAFDLALRHLQAGRLGEAEALGRQLLAALPGNADLLQFLGVIADQAGQPEVARDFLQRAIAADPANPNSYSNLGANLLDAGRAEEAAAACEKAIQLQPNLAPAHYNLGNARRAQGQFDAAIAAYQTSLRLHPSDPAALSNLGLAFAGKGRFDDAIAAYHAALGGHPNIPAVYNNLGYAHQELGRIAEACDFYRRGLALAPGHGGIHSNLLYALCFHPGCDAAALAQELRGWQRQHAAPLEAQHQPHPNDRSPDRRLRVGYVSPNFSRHVICHFLAPLLEAHDHTAFEVYAYSNVRRPDRITERLRKSVDVWRDVQALDDAALAERIRGDEIDILVDLTQHMAENRMPVFARRPAPVQVAWLGYPGSTGLRAMDYRLTDALMEPEGSPWSESVEKVVRLPDSWFCFDPIEVFPEPGEVPSGRTGFVTFGCLNAFTKVNEAVLERWAGVINAVPGSRLLLRCPEGTAQARVREFFAGRGIVAGRVELVAWTASRAEFLELFQRIDIALDPFPYNGGTTTCESLWMGVPVLTLPGETIVSRIGLSILTAAGMPEMVAHSEADYLRLAVSVAADLPLRAHWRATLRQRMKASAFMDGPRFARNVEAAYRSMWHQWCAR